MFKIFGTVDKLQRLKSFISQTTSQAWTLVQQRWKFFRYYFKITDYFFWLRVTIVRKPSIALCSLKWNERWYRYGCASIYWTKIQWSKIHWFR